jgi:hypothetical protein
MGIEKDFLMRQLMLLFEVIHKILRHRKTGDREKAFEQIKYFYELLKIDDEIDLMNIEQLTKFLRKDKNLTTEQIEMIAFVLKEQGELSEQDEKKHDFFGKSYFLLQKVEQESVTFSMDRQMKLAELKAWLK